MSRIEKTSKNAIWSLIYTFVSCATGFVARWIFMRTLGETYLGLNGMFTSLLNVLSFTELGLGTSIAFCFYKPIAERDVQQIRALLRFCRRAFGLIMLAIAALGLAMLPVLPALVKENAAGIAHFYTCYLIALLNTVSSYLLAYKTCYQTAYQESYRTTRISTVFWALTSLAQILILLYTRNYLLYLTVTCLMSLAERLFTSWMLSRWYPILRQKTDRKLAPETLRAIRMNVEAVILNNISYTLVNQTDSLITSKFIGLSALGLLSNYTLVRDTVNTLARFLPNSITGSMGNLVATESSDRQLQVFGIYELLCSWVYTFCFCGLAVFLSPFLSLVFGADKVVDETAVFFICLANLLNAQQTIPDLLRSTHGAYKVGRMLGLVQAAANLLLSVPLAMCWGLRGVYIGTVLSALIPYLAKPYLVFRRLYGKSGRSYYKTVIWQSVSAVGICLALWGIRAAVYARFSGAAAFGLTLVGTGAAFCPLLLLCSARNRYFRQTMALLLGLVRSLLQRGKTR